MASVVAGAFILFMAGATAIHLGLPPTRQLVVLEDTLRQLYREGRAYLGVSPIQHLKPLEFDRTGYSGDPALTQPGVTLLVSIFDEKLTARLYGADGTMVHEYPVDFSSSSALARPTAITR